MEPKKDGSRQWQGPSATLWGLGLGIGVALGVVFGLVFDNIGVGIALGASLGAAFALAFSDNRTRVSPRDQDSPGD